MGVKRGFVKGVMEWIIGGVQSGVQGPEHRRMTRGSSSIAASRFPEKPGTEGNCLRQIAAGAWRLTMRGGSWVFEEGKSQNIEGLPVRQDQWDLQHSGIISNRTVGVLTHAWLLWAMIGAAGGEEGRGNKGGETRGEVMELAEKRAFDHRTENYQLNACWGWDPTPKAPWEMLARQKNWPLHWDTALQLLTHTKNSFSCLTWTSLFGDSASQRHIGMNEWCHCTHMWTHICMLSWSDSAAARSILTIAGGKWSIVEM